ncbi:MAG TPA: TonB-dependent receptor [Flavitalea sp.]|nr:TonB-dependent receptor [Flavitalea sp.]
MKKRLRYFLTVCGVLLLGMSVFAQQVIRGTLRSPSGEPLIGASVTVKGTNRSVATNASGQFAINAPVGGTLVVTSVGFQPKEIVITGDDISDVLQVGDASMSEVVVIGYQTVRKRDLTGATAVINPVNASRISSNNLAESIQGLAPGVNVRTGGAPGQGAVIEIRGVASFTDANPLYVIDGMIADANSTVNTNDIASIQVLKDASAAAIYGSRAANGVVIITTKQGREGPARVGFSVKYGIQMLPKKWDLMDNRSFANLQKQQYLNAGLPAPPSVDANFDPSINTNWQDEITQVGSMQDYNLSLSGGSNTSNYFLSGSYYKNDGVIIGRSFERASLRLNTKTQRGRVTFGENMMLSNSNVGSPNEGNPFYDFPQMLPVIPIRDPKYISPTNPQGWGIGSTDAVSYAYNPVAVNDLSRRSSNFAKLVGNGYIDVRIFNWLSYKFNAGVEVSFDHNKILRKVGIWQFNGAPKPSSVDEDRSRFLSLLFEHTLNFNKTFGAHAINGVIGYSQQHTNREFTLGGRTDLQIFNGNYMSTVTSATGTSTAGGGTPVDYRIYGYLGRLNYSYDDKYLLTLSGRIDQDSRFGQNFRTGYFPSVAASWRVSREKFFTVVWISDLKIRASYGELGIVPLGSWDYTAFINNSPRVILGPGQTANNGSTQARLANPDLKWEARITKNLGFDAAFLNNRLTLSLDAYNSLSRDALLQLPVAGYLGNLQGDPFVNAGSIRNTGIEVAATYRNNSRAVKWDAGVNFTTIHNEVESVGNRGVGIDYIQIGNTRTKVGRSLGEWYVIQTAGLFQSQADIDNYKNKAGAIIQPKAKPGDVKYVDLNDDGTINSEDRTFAGSPWPKLQTGAQFNATFQQFSFNLQLVGVFGFKVYNDVRRILDSYQRSNFRSDISPWTTNNTGTSDPRLGLDSDQGIIDNNKGDTERWLEKGSYVRVRNLEIGYTLGNNILNRVQFKGVKIFVSAQNLLTITKYKGLDPDVVGLGLYERGYDSGNWPPSRILSLGVQCEF